MVDLVKQLDKLANTASTAANIIRGKSLDAELNPREVETFTAAIREINAAGGVIVKLTKKLRAKGIR